MALNKVTRTLSEKSINYRVIDRRDNYTPFEEEEFKQNNKYVDVFLYLWVVLIYGCE